MTRPGTAPVSDGDLLAGKYRVERVLGSGGMGIVVAARHEQLDQMVAIKFVRDDALSNEEAVQRFLREARAAVKLKSEHVARVLDVGKLESGAPYMVMEYLDGSDLAKVLTDESPIAIATCASWIVQACEAVAEAHAAGIVHRDLKPENLFLTSTVGGGRKVKVLDFGVSKAIAGASSEMSNLTRTSAMLGSPLYMAPEQMRSSRDVDPRADIWALGVVLFQLLTQRWPFEAETMPDLCLKVVAEPPLPLASLRPEVPAGLVAVVERCLEKDPAKRFASASMLATALAPFAHPSSHGLGATGEPQAPAPRSARSARSVGSPAASTKGEPPSSSASPGTPGTAAAWGAERAQGPLATTRRARPALLVLGVVAGGVGIATLLFVGLRSGGRSASTASGVSDSPAVVGAADSTAIPSALVRGAPPPPAAEVRVQSSEDTGASTSTAASLDSSARAAVEEVPRPSPTVRAPRAEPRPSKTPTKTPASEQDDDIPNVR